MAVLRMSLGRMGTGAGGHGGGSATSPGGFMGSRGTVGAGAGALGALACDGPCMVKATGGAAWPAVRLSAGARTSCPPTPGGSAAWTNKNKSAINVRLIALNTKWAFVLFLHLGKLNLVFKFSTARWG